MSSIFVGFFKSSNFLCHLYLQYQKEYSLSKVKSGIKVMKEHGRNLSKNMAPKLLGISWASNASVLNLRNIGVFWMQ